MTLRAALEAHLQEELGDATTAQALADIVWQETLSWHAPVIAPDRITTVIAFTFGNRMLANGNREPGPVNEALATSSPRCISALARACSRNGKSPRRWANACRVT